MKLRLATLLLLLVPVGLQANPAILNPQSLIAFWVVAFWALVIESGIATLTLSSCGVLVLPVFATLVVTNVETFAFGFMPLLVWSLRGCTYEMMPITWLPSEINTGRSPGA